MTHLFNHTFDGSMFIDKYSAIIAGLSDMDASIANLLLRCRE